MVSCRVGVNYRGNKSHHRSAHLAGGFINSMQWVVEGSSRIRIRIVELELSLLPSILLSFYVSNRYLLFVRARQRRAWAMCGLTRVLFEGNWSLFLFYCFYWTLIQYLDLDTNTFFHYFMPAWFDPNIQSNLRWVRVVGRLSRLVLGRAAKSQEDCPIFIFSSPQSFATFLLHSNYRHNSVYSS